MSCSEPLAIVQARMSSRRFPGKMLAPLAGRPLVAHVIDRVAEAAGRQRVVLATSIARSDDPLALYAESLGVIVHRGDLCNVFERFRQCLVAHPCPWFFRISGDSPRMAPELLVQFLRIAERTEADLVTNLHPRSFPRGHSVELIRTSRFLQIDASQLTPEEQEHVTPVYYSNPACFGIHNIHSGDATLADRNYCVDTPEDLQRLEAQVI